MGLLNLEKKLLVTYSFKYKIFYSSHRVPENSYKSLGENDF